VEIGIPRYDYPPLIIVIVAAALIFIAGGVTAQAVAEGVERLIMFIHHFALAVTGKAGPGSQRARVTVAAGTGIAVPHREGVRQIERCRPPGGNGMAV